MLAVPLIAIMLASTVASQSGIEVGFKVYGVNSFGWEMTHVITKVHGELATPYSFDTRLSYTSREAWVAWWCFTCYANAQPTYTLVRSDVVGEDTSWSQGSWNARYNGTNHVWLYINGYYSVRESVYYDVNGVTNTFVDAVRNAINFITDNLSKLLHG